MQQITIFGGTGFIGRYLVRELAKTGIRIHIATRSPERVLPLKHAGNVGQIVAVPCNLRDDASVAAALRGSDAAVNLTGILFQRGRNRFNTIHADVPRRIARIAKAANVKRFIHVSALGADATSKSAYARSKAAGEEAASEEFPGTTVLRPSIVFGPEDGFFNMFAGLAKLFPALPLIGGGKTKFQPVYVGDVADAIMAALSRTEASGQTYELGGPQVYSFKQLLKLMLAETGLDRWLVPAPFWAAKLKAYFLQLLPRPLLTPDQVELLKRDNIVSQGAHKLADLGITPTALEVILPTYMDRYRAGGRFTRRPHPKAA
ncbi:MAG: NAD-dependent epimerase/dehydratase family protein [Alphaproteobacteria bacterium]|nr:NAD-dependent epimerase/dehydratase family protein [Alphaproteobacteria bacterium]